MKRRNLLVTGMAALIGLAAGSASTSVHAQTYPTKTITIVVGFPPGGTNDLTARLLAPALSKELGQQVVVENRAGLGGRMAAGYVAEQQPGDGYTIYLFTRTTLPLGHLLYPNLKYDPVKDFEPIGRIGATPNILLVSSNVPAKDLKELMEYGKANPGKLNYGSVSTASPSIISFTALEKVAGATFTNIPYKSNGQLLTDLASGDAIQLHWDNLPTGIQQVKTGRVRAFAVDSEQRSAAAPDIPAVREFFPNFKTYDNYFGLLAPAGTPAAVLNRLDEALEKAVKDPDVVKSFAELGLTPLSETREELRAIMAADMAELPKFVTENNLIPAR
jgi:tripartite-type tricarboxylate transporter receptor subunit TctC